MSAVVSVSQVCSLLAEYEEKSEVLETALHPLRKQLGREKLPHFLAVACSYITVDVAEHTDMYKQLEMYAKGCFESGRRARSSILPCSEDTPSVLIFFWSRNKLAGRQLPLLELVLRLGMFVKEWLKKSEKGSWRQLPGSLYRAMELHLPPAVWRRLPHFQRYREGKLPAELYSILLPSDYLEQSARSAVLEEREAGKKKRPYRPQDRGSSKREKNVQAASLAAYAIIKHRLLDSSEAAAAYSRLCHCLATCSSDYGENWLAELAAEILDSKSSGSYSKLYGLLQGLPDAVQDHQRNQSCRYHVRSAQQVKDVENTILGSLPREQQAYVQLHQRCQGKGVLLRFPLDSVDSLALHSTMDKLRQTYRAAGLQSDYVIFQDEEASYLALSKQEHKLITRGLLPHLRVNGYFPHCVLPVFLQLADGLLNGRKLLTHISLQSVYDLVVGWSTRQEYFQRVRPELLRVSVRLLCRYAHCFGSGEEVLRALKEPYWESSLLQTGVRGQKRRATALLGGCGVQEAVKGIILLDEVHHMRQTDLDHLLHLIAEEKVGSDCWEEWKQLKEWARCNSRRRNQSTEAGDESAMITLRRKPYTWLYSYILESGCFLDSDSRQLCECVVVRSCVNQGFRTPIPAQSPGLTLAQSLESEPAASLVAKQMRQQRKQRKHCRNREGEQGSESLCLLLQQLEYFRLHSPQKESADYRLRLRAAASYLPPPYYQRWLQHKKTELPLLLRGESVESCKQLFPVYGAPFYGLEDLRRVLHAADPYLLCLMYYAPLPEAVLPARRRLQTLSQRARKRSRPL